MHDSAYAKRQIALLDRVVGGCGSRVQRLAFIGSQRLRSYAACLPTITIFCATRPKGMPVVSAPTPPGIGARTPVDVFAGEHKGIQSSGLRRSLS